ncbi:hypothetical protein [uncultured Chryseobacterium sp.]|uniref:hypothetical protein n=1 Tax=uncultured Chryseobacterium sp. TaxID=259322 RepID=UPI0037478E13
MKKNTPDFASGGHTRRIKHSGLRLITAFFSLYNLPEAKNLLFEIMQYAMKRCVSIPRDPGEILEFCHYIRSFVRGSYLMQFKTKQWFLDDPSDHPSELLQGNLSDEEYHHPFLTFKNAFTAYTLDEFDDFLNEAVYFSLVACHTLPGNNLISPLIHLAKMLDAAQVLVERGIRRR